MTTHAHASAHPHAETPPQTTDAIAVAARELVDAAARLGPRITDHGYGCPAQHAGPCTCGSNDFQAALHALGTALQALPGTPTQQRAV